MLNSFAMDKKKAAFWTFACVAAALQAWAYRFWIEPDGVNYLDIASAYVRHDWAAAINTYWSPLYSWILAITLYAFRPPMYWESTVLHALNFLIFLAALGCGVFFIKELIATREESNLLPSWALWWIGCCLLLFVSLFMSAVYLDTPDLLMCVFAYLAAGLLLRIRSGGGGPEDLRPVRSGSCVRIFRENDHVPSGFCILARRVASAGYDQFRLFFCDRRSVGFDYGTRCETRHVR